MNKKIKIAFVKYGGLTSGGSEKMLQIIAANLPKDRFQVDYFYSDLAPHALSDGVVAGTDEHRREYLVSHGVKIIKFDVKFLDIFTPTKVWLGTNFFDVFNEDDYDIIQSCRAGHKEYPFTKIRKNQ